MTIRLSVVGLAALVPSMIAAPALADSAQDTYRLRSEACENIRTTLQVCVPSEGERKELCKKATAFLLPAAFDDLRSSAEGDAGKLGKIDDFQERTDERLKRFAGATEETTDALNGAARDEIAVSRTECFSLIEELE